MDTKWIKDRLREPSTYRGIVALAALAGVSISPEQWEAITAVAVGVYGLIQVFRKEAK